MFLKKKNKQNTILFIAHKGKNSYGGNMKFVADEIIRQNLPCQIYFYVKHNVIRKLKLKKKDNYGFPKEIKIIYYKHSLKRIAKKSKIILTDNFFITNRLLKGFKKTNQFIINTWHGSLGIKKIDLFTLHLNDEVYYNNSRKEFNAIDVMVSNCEWESEIYKNDLQFNNTIKMLGHPRNDIFFLSPDKNAEIKQKIHENLHIPDDNYLVLIAPTYRFQASTEKYKQTLSYDFDALKQCFEKRFGKPCTIALRLHPELKKERVSECFKEGIIDATSYPDIQELLVAADAMITDYSSCIFDFLFTRKPGFIFAPDRKHYEMTRGLYFPLEESPFPVAEDNETLCKNIINFDNDFYQKRVEEFLKSRNVVDDGHASERVVALIKQHLI